MPKAKYIFAPIIKNSMSEAEARLSLLADNHPDFNPFESLDNGFKELTKSPLYYILFFIASIVIQLGVGFIPVIGSIIGLVISQPILMGIAWYWHAKILSGKKEESFATFTQPFKVAIPLLNYTLTVVGFSLIIILPILLTLGALGYNGTDDLSLKELGLSATEVLAFSGFILATFLFLIYLSVSIILAPYFVLFYGISAWRSIRLSMRFTKGYWWKYFSFWLLCGLVGIAGMLCLVVGLALAIPVIRLAYYDVFSKVTQLHGTYSEFDFEDQL
jgi:uncharacterized membrane protein